VLVKKRDYYDYGISESHGLVRGVKRLQFTDLCSLKKTRVDERQRTRLVLKRRYQVKKGKTLAELLKQA
jgi:hypothetical protein